MRKVIFISMTMAFLATSCQFLHGVIGGDDVIARVGSERLYRSEVEGVVPQGLSSEDSAAVASRYIETWAAALVYADVADKGLSKTEKDVSAQLKQYENALLKYRFEQRYVNERLDTSVTAEQIQAYYDTNRDKFVLEYPIAKARFVRILPDSPNCDRIRRLLSSDDVEDKALLDTLAYMSAARYTDFSGEWVDIMALAREFKVDYGTLLSEKKGDRIEMTDTEGMSCIAWMEEYMRAGSVPPVEYCADRIRDVIISARKQEILLGLERDLLEQARTRGFFETYQEQ